MSALTFQSAFAPRLRRRHCQSGVTPTFARLETPAAQAAAARAPRCVREANIVVVGGGPVGSVAAALLSQRGVQTTLLERQSDLSRFEVSRAYSLALTPRGIAVVSRVPALAERLANIAARATDAYTFTAVMPDGVANDLGQLPIVLDDAADGPDGAAAAAKRTPIQWLLRPRLQQCLRDFLEADPRVTTRYGAEMDTLQVLPDGSLRVHFSHDGVRRTVDTKLLLVCDGARSTALHELRRLEEEAMGGEVSVDDGSDTTPRVTSRNGLNREWRDSPSVGLRVSSVVVDSTAFTTRIARPEDDLADHMYGLVPAADAPAGRAFRLGSFPSTTADRQLLGGVKCTTVSPASAAVWQIADVDAAYDLFARTFPQLGDVRTAIGAKSMRAFVQEPPLRFPPIGRARSLSARVGVASGAAVVGDAAHVFPPDLGQGVNAGLEDVARLMDAIGDAADDTPLHDILDEYERRREPEIDALIRMMTYGAPFQYGQDRTRARLEMLNNLLRTVFAKRAPGVFYPPMITMMMGTDWPYPQIERGYRQTTVLLAAMAATVLAAIVAIVVVACSPS